MSVKELKTEDFEKALTGHAFLEFYSPDCTYCRMSEPLVEKLSEEFGGIDFYKVNTSANEALAHDCRIRSLPTFIMMSDGKEVGRVFGAKNEKALKELISLA